MSSSMLILFTFTAHLKHGQPFQIRNAGDLNRPLVFLPLQYMEEWSFSASAYFELPQSNFFPTVKLILFLEAVIKQSYNMESTTVGDDETQSKGRIKILAAVNNENSLCLAVQNRKLSSFSSLLRQGIPMTSRAIRLMFKSWPNQGSEFCEAWLREGGRLNGFYEDSTPLKLALGHETCMCWLLEHGADPNVPPLLGKTVDLLTLAAASFPPSAVRLLVEHGARRKGTQALHAAAITSATEIYEANFQPNPSRVEVLKMLLDHGADANDMEVDPKELGRPRASYTGTPLHRAARHGSVEAVQCLLAYGADLSSPSWSGLTAMEVAQIYRRQDMVDALRNHIDRASGQDGLSVRKAVSC
ncbi:hypothetical protein INS49_013227 [Diaporthe citri]|uniref:uncharacterized protein n=1 Tax=Diaporthe citri TaxID=83186 RepID=UPI001C81A2C0|nr:uncharacterized protein INS49_013227 [Diaporthe citri]KAG6357351.1 hypothetical protein INS49_013227 [Diaporthe citri]